MPVIYGALRANSVDELVTDEAMGAAILTLKNKMGP